MLKCRDASRLIASGQGETLGFWKKLELRLHLLMCDSCRRYLAQVRAIGRGMRNLAARDQPDPEDLERLEKDIVEEMRRQDPD